MTPDDIKTRLQTYQGRFTIEPGGAIRCGDDCPLTLLMREAGWTPPANTPPDDIAWFYVHADEVLALDPLLVEAIADAADIRGPKLMIESYGWRQFLESLCQPAPA